MLDGTTSFQLQNDTLVWHIWITIACSPDLWQNLRLTFIVVNYRWIRQRTELFLRHGWCNNVTSCKRTSIFQMSTTKQCMMARFTFATISNTTLGNMSHFQTTKTQPKWLNRIFPICYTKFNQIPAALSRMALATECASMLWVDLHHSSVIGQLTLCFSGTAMAASYFWQLEDFLNEADGSRRRISFFRNSSNQSRPLSWLSPSRIQNKLP